MSYESLTTRQKEVLRLRAYGLSKEHIGRKLKIANSTVNMHLDSAFNRLYISGLKSQHHPWALACIAYWQNNIEELKSINIEELK